MSCRVDSCSVSPIARALIPSPDADRRRRAGVDGRRLAAHVDRQPVQALRDELGISIVYITHDLATAYYISDRIVIMQRGKVVESGDARSVLANPQHPYSRQLKSAVLLPDTTARVQPRNGEPSHASKLT